MSPERARHLVEAVLDDQGWAVYRLALGSGPALAAGAPDGAVLSVAVARASEPTGPGRVYPRLDRIGTADVLASVTSQGVVSFHTPAQPSGAALLAGVGTTTHAAPPPALVALPGGEDQARA